MGGTKEIFLSVDLRCFDHAPQLSINDGDGGYRIAGAKYDGSSKPILKHVLTPTDVKEIRRYLNKVEAA